MPADAPPVQADLVRRLRCAEGHLRGIAAMIERGDDCESVIRQTLAAQAALREITRLALKHHLSVCLREHWHNENAAAREKRVAEVVSLYQLVAYR